MDWGAVSALAVLAHGLLRILAEMLERELDREAAARASSGLDPERS